MLEPLGFEGDVIPKALVDFLAGQEDDEDELHTNIEDKDDDDDDDGFVWLNPLLLNLYMYLYIIICCTLMPWSTWGWNIIHFSIF